MNRLAAPIVALLLLVGLSLLPAGPAYAGGKLDAFLATVKANKTAIKMATEAIPNSERAARYSIKAYERTELFKTVVDLTKRNLDVWLQSDWREASAKAVGSIITVLTSWGVSEAIGVAAAAACLATVSGAVMVPLCYYTAVAGANLLFDQTHLAETLGELAEGGLRHLLAPPKPETNGVPNGGGVTVGNVDISVRTQNVTTTATGQSSAVTDVGVVQGGDAQVSATVRGDVVTSASGRSNAYTGIGVVSGSGGTANVEVGGGVTTRAKGEAQASSEIGMVNGGGDVTVQIGGGVNTSASGSGVAKTEIGKSDGGSVSAMVGGTVSTTSSGGSSTTRIGTGQSAAVSGSVINTGGDLSIGGLCRARRNGRCCIDIHFGWCVLQEVPPSKTGCPPRFEFSNGLCYLYSDKIHSISP